MTKNNLNIAANLKLSANGVTQKFGWLGTTGSGKTYGASKFAEEIWHAGAQFVVLDPVGVWYGLRLAKDGKKPSDIDIPIFGGLHGDIPLEATSGAMIADLIVDKNLSVILDVSQFESDASKARFAGDFAARFFFRKKASPSAVHLFIEECQEFVPQNPQRGEEKMLHEFIRMQKLGRNFGIGSSYITQRPQEVNKKALNMAQTLFVFRTTGTHERKAIEQWIQDKSLDQDIAQDLPKLATGTCHVWSPEFLKISETAKILEKETFNASATPEVGKSTKVVRMADINIPAIKEAMAATIEKAKGEDPKLLQKEISRLKSELIGKKGQNDPREVEKAAVAARQKAGLEWEKLVVKEWERYAKDLRSTLERSAAAGTQALNVPLPQMTPPNWMTPSNLEKVTLKKENMRGHRPDYTVIDEAGPVSERIWKNIEKKVFRKNWNTPVTDQNVHEREMAYVMGNDKPLSKGARLILTYLHQSYPHWKTKAQCWIATGYAPGGGFNNIIYELIGAGYIKKDATGSYAAKFEVFSDDLLDPSFDASLDKWNSKLSLGAQKVFNILRSESDLTFSKDALAGMTNYAQGGGFNNIIYELTGKELAVKVGTNYQINPLVLDL